MGFQMAEESLPLMISARRRRLKGGAALRWAHQGQRRVRLEDSTRPSMSLDFINFIAMLDGYRWT
jgi:hypothetical protein